MSVEQQKKMYDHFSKISTTYGQMRTTDIEPIIFISNKLKHLREIEAVDIGCGEGRYDLLLFQHLKNLRLTCIDINESMLKKTSHCLKSNGITNFKIIKINVNADELPIEANSIDCIFTFNTMNQFDIPTFMDKTAKVIKESGLIFIYTRLRSQNTRNIWGKYFPWFSEKETRLPELDEIETLINSSKFLSIEYIKNFKFKRKATLKQLINKARNRFYSAFSLYNEEELKDAIEKFEKNIINDFIDTNHIEWFDEYSLFIIKHSL